MKGLKTQDYRDKDQLGELPTERQLFGNKTKSIDKDSVFS